MSTRPTGEVILNDDTRARYRLAFDSHQADRYHRLRPGYQPEILEFFNPGPPVTAIDLGAGTGHFTDLLVNSGYDVVAVDPAAHMLQELTNRHPQVTAITTRLEDLDTTPWQHRANLVVCAQAWHWIDPAIGSQQAHNLLTPDGVLGIVHHQIDTSQPWALRLCRIMHSGDVHPIELAPVLSTQFQPPVGKWWQWEQPLSVDQLHELMMTRAFYLRTNNKQRSRMHHNLNWYLTSHLGYRTTDTIAIPYVTAAWRSQPVGKPQDKVVA